MHGWALLFALAAAPDAEPHLREGAIAFRAERYDAALVEFKVASRLGAPQADWYVGAALVKLGRSQDAVDAFAEARERAPNAEDALLDYYAATACHDARLFVCADRLLGRITPRAGPKIASLAAELRARLLPVLRATPERSTIDWYLAEARLAEKAGKRARAQLYFAESAALASRRADHYGLRESTGKERTP